MLDLDSCPNCGLTSWQSFYQVTNIPTHSCLLMDSVKEAVDFPTADLELVHCLDCGFIFNRLWNEKYVSYSSSYEETQHFSDTFNSFAKSLASQWIEEFHIEEKTILEIGCGKAEFLQLICELGNNKGIGIDPGVIPERFSSKQLESLTLIPKYFSKHHLQNETEVILCRHTLEHIYDTKDLIGLISSAIGNREEVIVLFELPDMTRVLQECAFWDIYYEHCSYFTAGSLARLFRASGFEIEDLQRAYDDQYLLIAARKTAEKKAYFVLEDDLKLTQQQVAQFERNIEVVIRQWRERLQYLRATNNRVIAWGAGSKCVSFCTTLGLTDEIEYAVDINPHKQGKFLPGTGHQVVGPEYLNIAPPDFIVVMNPIYCDEIKAMLKSMQIKADLIPLK